MPDIANAPVEQRAKLGALVAELKTDLHEAEQHITAEKIGSVDWAKLLDRLRALLALIDLLRGGADEAPVQPVKHHTPSPKHHR